MPYFWASTFIDISIFKSTYLMVIFRFFKVSFCFPPNNFIKASLNVTNPNNDGIQ